MSIAELQAQAEHDGGAALALAERLLVGAECDPDSKEAMRWVRKSAELGNPDGRRAWVYATAAGIGGKADWDAALAMMAELGNEDRFAAVQLALLNHVTCDRKLAEIEPRIISAEPYIAVYEGLFSEAECRYLMMIASPWMEKAEVLGLDGKARLDPVRDANYAPIVFLAEDLVVQVINRTIAAATGTEKGWGEPLNILRYHPGQQYKPHHDGTGADNVSVRNLTALIWLNDGYEGGETDFPQLGVKVRGAVGDMMVFRNVRDDGSMDERMIHAGLPVTSGVKWMASRWIRGENYLRG